MGLKCPETVHYIQSLLRLWNENLHVKNRGLIVAIGETCVIKGTHGCDLHVFEKDRTATYIDKKFIKYKKCGGDVGDIWNRADDMIGFSRYHNFANNVMPWS